MNKTEQILEPAIFTYQKLGNVRAYNIDDQPWFVAVDVCKILGLKNPTSAVARLDQTERTKLNLGRQGMGNVINESGLYSLIITSKKKDALKFKKWITIEVIPSIRKHGAYLTPQTIEKIIKDPDFLVEIANELKTERQARLKAEKIIVKNQPKVRLANAISASKDCITVNTLAKILRQNGINIGQNRLFEQLRYRGYLQSLKDNKNLPTQTAMYNNLFRVKETARVLKNGFVGVNKKTMVTGKGQEYFVNLFLAKKEDIHE